LVDWEGGGSSEEEEEEEEEDVTVDAARMCGRKRAVGGLALLMRRLAGLVRALEGAMVKVEDC
jgi:hypothetical protein